MEEEQFQCDICQLKFIKLSAWKKHYQNAHNKKLYPCDFCETQCVSKYLLEKHKIYKHFPADRFECDLCELTFKSVGTLKRHNQNIHLEKLIQCEFCDRSLKSGSLTRHVQHYHSIKGGLTVSCEICGKSFSSQNGNLEAHKEQVHYQSMVNCNICHITVTKRALRNHQKYVHEKFEAFCCNHCTVIQD